MAKTTTQKLLLAAAITYSCLVGCTATNSTSSLDSKAARMSPDLLRSQVLRYKALLEKDEPAVTEFFNSIVPPGTAFTPDTAAKINKALIEDPVMNETINRHTENLVSYHLFYDKLKDKGGDMTGLELDIHSDFEKHLSPP
ncbi:MAG: hypothetical protein ACYSOC_05125, partial [Planctomycetota bacterium]